VTWLFNILILEYNLLKYSLFEEFTLIGWNIARAQSFRIIKSDLLSKMQKIKKKITPLK